jgi:hypothetical protein
VAALDNLVPKNNWLAVSRTATAEEAVKAVEAEFWLIPNCGSGCGTASIAIFSDETFDHAYEISNPN